MDAWKNNEMVCKPLKTYDEINVFLQNPPAWRTLCKELQPHSKMMIKNLDLQSDLVSRNLIEDDADTFCHFSPDIEDVLRHEENNLPRTLVCHDMANGYHDDCIIDGTGKYDAYTFYNWAGIDIFCYFSHHLITIPPLAWINVAHEHGVKVIGTVITEWAKGAEFWDRVLSSEAEYRLFASALVAIAKTLKFEGWLLNVENKISKPDVLLAFVRHLHQLMHQELPHAELIWYDSVTVDGRLNWQNALNDKNRAFFDACDGIFTNYSWSEADVRRSADEAAGAGRLRDLYVGADVWGRNFFGGGQFNLRQAIEVAYKYGCSMAIFAPAWTHEAMCLEAGDPNTVALADGLEPYRHFLLRDRALWDSVWRYLNTRVPCALPFKTSFCRGQGKKRRMYGEVLCPVPWYNLRHMQYQPNSSHGVHGYLLSTIAKILQMSQRKLDINEQPFTVAEEPAIEQDITNNCTELEINEKPFTVTEEPAIEQDISNNCTQVEAPASPQKNNSTAIDAASDSANVSLNSNSSKDKNSKRKLKDMLKHIFHKPKLTKREELDKPEDLQLVQELQSNELHEKEEPGTLKVRFEQQESCVSVDTEKTAKEDTEQKNQESSTSLQVFSEEESVAAIAAPSMVQTSVNLKLGHSLDKTRYQLAYLDDDFECLEVYFEDSFIGGSCLKVNPIENNLIRIFHCDFFCQDSLIVCVVTKTLPEHPDQFLNVHLFMRDERGEVSRVVLIGRDQQSHADTQKISYLHPLNNTSDSVFRDLQKYLLLNESGSYVPVENAYNWGVRYYEVRRPGARVTSINCNTGPDTSPILLGHLGICHKSTCCGSR